MKKLNMLVNGKTFDQLELKDKMFSNKRQKNILRIPKIYSAPKDQIKKPVPKVVKYIIFIFLILAGLFYMLFFSSFFTIKNIATEGGPTDETLVYLEQFKGKNIFMIRAKEIADVLKEKNTQFKTVDVSCGIPNTLRVIFAERLPVVAWQTGGKNYLVDENAIAFKQTETLSQDLIVVVDNKNIAINPPVQIASSKFIDFLKNVNVKINQLGIKVIKYEINETTFQVDAVTDKNIKIIFDTTRSVSDQMDAVEKAYKEKKSEITQYMDVRVEGKVYYQ